MGSERRRSKVCEKKEKKSGETSKSSSKTMANCADGYRLNVAVREA